jgi:mRNA-degrading endonuclease toxin of MazEF toxin-antitoxin module
MKRGDVVTVDFSRYDPADKVRPALVVQNDRDNMRMTKTIVALITTNIDRAGADTQYLIESSHSDFLLLGLHRDSAVNCSNLYTIRQSDISRVVGTLSQKTMEQIGNRLKAALELG